MKIEIDMMPRHQKLEELEQTLEKLQRDTNYLNTSLPVWIAQYQAVLKAIQSENQQFPPQLWSIRRWIERLTKRKPPKFEKDTA